MGVISALVIEDNKEAQEYLIGLLETNHPEISINGTASSINKGVEIITNVSPDLVFMDIELEDGMSFEILDNLSEHDFDIIFTTGFNNFFEKAMQHFAFSYLLKPIDPQALDRVLKRYKEVKDRHSLKSKYEHYKEFARESQSKILLNTGNSYQATAIDQIVACQAEGNYTLFLLENGEKLLASHILKHYEALFQFKGFFRPNRSTLINTKHITSIIKKETIILTNKIKIPISSRKKGELDALIDSLT